jgi:hypothetical protein
MHYIDINLFMPTFHHHDFHFGLYDLATMLGFAAIFIGGFNILLQEV